jgi:hypothetical protein
VYAIAHEPSPIALSFDKSSLQLLFRDKHLRADRITRKRNLRWAIPGMVDVTCGEPHHVISQ